MVSRMTEFMTRSWFRMRSPTLSSCFEEVPKGRNIQSVSLDLAHGEIYVASLTGKRVNVFAWNANGDATPLRVIEGPSTNLGHTVGIAVDTVTNLVAVANSRDILIFY